MKRSYRLRRPHQFQRVRREGKTFNHHLLRLNTAPNRLQRTRCGFVVSKRLGKAVQRNRAKRRVREAVRRMFDHIEPGMDVVFIIRSHEIVNIAFTQLLDIVQQLLHRAGIWREPATSNDQKD